MKSRNANLAVNKAIPHPVKDKINYEDLVELMHVRHQTRKSIARTCGVTQQAYGRWIKSGLLMPGSVILETARILGVPYERFGEIFFCVMVRNCSIRYRKIGPIDVIESEKQTKYFPDVRTEKVATNKE